MKFGDAMDISHFIDVWGQDVGSAMKETLYDSIALGLIDEDDKTALNNSFDAIDAAFASAGFTPEKIAKYYSLLMSKGLDAEQIGNIAASDNIIEAITSDVGEVTDAMLDWNQTLGALLSDSAVTVEDKIGLVDGVIQELNNNLADGQTNLNDFASTVNALGKTKANQLKNMLGVDDDTW